MPRQQVHDSKDTATMWSRATKRSAVEATIEDKRRMNKNKMESSTGV